MIWSKLMEQAIGALKDEKVSLSVLVVGVLLAYYGYTWAGQEFVDRDDFNAHTEEVESKLTQLTSTVNAHVEEYRIVEASRVIRDLKRDIQIAEATSAPTAQIEKLREELGHAEDYKRCLIGRLPNCKHLRWPE